ncbi:hypothetical protein J3A83DRAFT_3474598 [Scleroderma citrinum]
MLFLLISRSLLFAFTALGLESVVWRAVCFAIVLCFALADTPSTRTGNGYFDYMMGTNLGMTVLQGMHHLLLRRPLEEFRHESDKVPAYRLPFVQRFFWIASISHRGIGWSFKDDHPIPVDPRHRTRRAFIISRLRTAFAFYWLFEAAHLYTRANPVFSTEASLALQGYILQCVNVIAFLSYPYAYLNCCHSLVAVVAVATNLSQPQTWPYLFGYWKDGYTIRRFWARTWHQICRHLVTIFGPHRYNQRPWDENPTKDPSIRKSKEPWLRAYLRICNAFLCSALLHVCGEFVLQFSIWENHISSGSLSPTRVYPPFVMGVSAPLFLFQPLGVLVEEAVIAVGKRLGVKTGMWTKLIGYAWVWVWMSLSTISSLDGLKNAVHVASPIHEWGAAQP